MLQSMGLSLLPLWERIFAATSPYSICFLFPATKPALTGAMLGPKPGLLSPLISKTDAAFQVLLSQPVALCTCIFFLSPGLHKGIPCVNAGKLLHPASPKITLAIVPGTSCCKLIVWCCMLPFYLSWPLKYPFPLLSLPLPTNVKVKPAPSSAVGAELGELHRPGAMAGHSGALLVGLHHQIWGLLPPCHHVPPLCDAQRVMFLASSQLGALPGRVRDHKAGFLIQAHSAFPTPSCLAIVQFKEGEL